MPVWRIVAMLLGIGSLFVLEYAVELPRDSVAFESCGQFAPETLAWRTRDPEDGSAFSNTLFHMHRLQPSCSEAMRAQAGLLGVGIVIVALGLLTDLVTPRWAAAGAAVASAAAFLFFVGQALWDGPVFPAMCLAIGSLGLGVRRAVVPSIARRSAESRHEARRNKTFD